MKYAPIFYRPLAGHIAVGPVTCEVTGFGGLDTFEPRLIDAASCMDGRFDRLQRSIRNDWRTAGQAREGYFERLA